MGGRGEAVVPPGRYGSIRTTVKTFWKYFIGKRNLVLIVWEREYMYGSRIVVHQICTYCFLGFLHKYNAVVHSLEASVGLCFCSLNVYAIGCRCCFSRGFLTYYYILLCWALFVYNLLSSCLPPYIHKSWRIRNTKFSALNIYIQYYELDWSHSMWRCVYIYFLR